MAKKLDISKHITLEDISEITAAKNGKIMILRGDDDSRLVLKADNVKPEQVKANKAVIKTVDPTLKTNILHAVEADEIIIYINRVVQDANQFARAVKLKDAPDRTIANMLATLNDVKEGRGFTVLKMNYQEVVDLKSADEERLNGEGTAIARFIAALVANPGKKDGGLETLGRLIAADMFNGNTDRFNPPGESDATYTIDGKNHSLSTLQNIGNVFINTTDQNAFVSALDFIDPNSRFAPQHIPITKIEKDEKVVWGFRSLFKKADREAFAAGVIKDLELILDHRNANKVKDRHVLGADRKKRIMAGMMYGIKDIEQKLTAKIAKLQSKNKNSLTPEDAGKLASMQGRLDLVKQVKE